MIEANIIEASFRYGVKKLLFLGSSCIYPRMASQPMAESALLTGPLEPTNEPYAIAKISGIKLCESFNRQYGHSHGIDYRCVMTTNLFGPGDNYHPENSHVLPALISRFHQAKIDNLPTVTLWGTGQAKREFLYVDDMASASLHVMNMSTDTYKQNTTPMQSHINVGSGIDIAISEVAGIIQKVVGYRGKITHDTSKPDGAPRKLMDSQKLQNLGWRPNYSLVQGLESTYDDFLKNSNLRKK